MCPKNDTTDFINQYVMNLIPGEASTFFIPRIPMTPSDSDFPFVLRRRQFPIRPAFCITINKGQGQS